MTLSRRIAVSLVFVAVSSWAMADWVSVGAGSGSGTHIYADPHSIFRAREMVKMWEMTDFQQPQTGSMQALEYQSYKILKEYDCKKEQHRSIAFVNFSGHMGDGTVTFSGDHPSPWVQVLHESVAYSLWKIACPQ